MQDTYIFRKGKSRASSTGTSSCNSSDTDSSPPIKKAKLNAEMREKETLDLRNILKNIQSHIQIKQALIERAKSVKDYKQCDHLATEIRKLMKERSDTERQIAALENKSAKSSWYKRKAKKSMIDQEERQHKIDPKKKKSEISMFMLQSSTSKDLDDTTVCIDGGDKAPCTKDKEIRESDGQIVGQSVDTKVKTAEPYVLSADASPDPTSPASSTDTVILENEEDFDKHF